MIAGWPLILLVNGLGDLLEQDAGMMVSAWDELRLAARELARPAGADLGFSAVGPVEGQHLPPPIRAAALRRQRGFSAGRRAAISALQAAGGPVGMGVGMGADRLPVWPAGWHGSITHTDDLAAAVVAPDCAILGLDLERLMSPHIASEVAGAIMPEAVAGHAGMSSAQEVSRVFSAKEALFKALFPQTRQFREFSAARVVWGAAGGPDKLRPLSLCLTEDWGADWRAGRALPVHQVIAAGHVLSLVWHDGSRIGG